MSELNIVFEKVINCSYIALLHLVVDQTWTLLRMLRI